MQLELVREREASQAALEGLAEEREAARLARAQAEFLRNELTAVQDGLQVGGGAGAGGYFKSVWLVWSCAQAGFLRSELTAMQDGLQVGGGAGGSVGGSPESV